MMSTQQARSSFRVQSRLCLTSKTRLESSLMVGGYNDGDDEMYDSELSVTRCYGLSTGPSGR